MTHLTTIKPLMDFKLRLAYDDGVEGIVDLSHLKGRGVFKIWDQPGAFENVYIGDSGQVAWSDEIDLCPDALYMKITGQKPEDVFVNLKKESELTRA